MNEDMIAQLVKQVMAGLETENTKPRHQLGVFDTMEEAIEACNKAYETFRYYSREQRENIIKEIRRLTHEEAETMAKLADNPVFCEHCGRLIYVYS